MNLFTPSKIILLWEQHIMKFKTKMLETINQSDCEYTMVVLRQIYGKIFLNKNISNFRRDVLPIWKIYNSIKKIIFLSCERLQSTDV